MGKNKDLKYRAVCPHCGKAFDTRHEGESYWGVLICADCTEKMLRYNELNDYRKDLRKK